MGCGCAGRGLRRNIRGRRPSHAVVAGCRAAVEGGWGLRGRPATACPLQVRVWFVYVWSGDPSQVRICPFPAC